jgi:hypothetical protein
MDWHDLHKMKVSDLRALAKEKTDLEGVTGLHKEELVAKLAEVMGIPRPHKVAEGEGKTAIKQRIRALKAERDQAIGAGDRDRLREIRHGLHREKRKLRRMAHLTH